MRIFTLYFLSGRTTELESVIQQLTQLAASLTDELGEPHELRLQAVPHDADGGNNAMYPHLMCADGTWKRNIEEIEVFLDAQRDSPAIERVA